MAEENQENQVGTDSNNVGNSQTNQEQTATFTQEKVNEIVQERLTRANQKFLKDYGFDTAEAMREMLEKGKMYDGKTNEYNDLKSKYDTLHEAHTFIKGNIADERKDDVLTYFKGKSIEFNEENLTEALKTHPEWLKQSENKTTITLGTEQPRKQQDDERTMAEKLFGVKFHN